MIGSRRAAAAAPHSISRSLFLNSIACCIYSIYLFTIDIERLRSILHFRRPLLPRNAAWQPSPRCVQHRMLRRYCPRQQNSIRACRCCCQRPRHCVAFDISMRYFRRARGRHTHFRIPTLPPPVLRAVVRRLRHLHPHTEPFSAPQLHPYKPNGKGFAAALLRPPQLRLLL